MKSRDEELVRQTLSGQIESFGELVSRYQGAVQGLAYHLTGNFEDAEDIAQETFITAYLKLRQLREPGSFVAWLRQITLNCCRMGARKRRDSVFIDDVAESSLGHAPSPAEELEREEMRSAVHNALSQLNEKNRLVAILHYLDGSSYSDIAHFLGVSVSTVEGRMHRARRQLERSLMKMVEDTLSSERLSDDFTRRVLKEAVKRAKEAQEKWAKESFVRSCHEALEAAGKLDDSKAQIELLSMLGDAGTTWLGGTEEAIENYESALQVARKHGDKAEEAKVLKAIFVAHCRHGKYDSMRQRAQEALKLFSELGDERNEALTKAALDLANELPGVWKPGQPGGYALAALPVEVSDDGYRFLDPESVRNYSWGCPSRCLALVHLLRPRRFLGPSLDVGATWEDHAARLPDGLSWGIEEDDEIAAKSAVESEDDTVFTPSGKFERCLRVKTLIEPKDGGTATEHRTRSYCGTRTAWLAPGIGLVKLHYENQNGIKWTVYLMEHSGPKGEGYFPLLSGRMWRYRWLGDRRMEGVFEDICRVTGSDGNTAYISSATWGVELPGDEVKRYLEELLKLEKQSGDLAGEAATLEELNSRLGGNEKERKLAYYERLVEIYEFLGDKWNSMDARGKLRAMKNELSSQESWQLWEEKLKLARQLRDWMQEARTLVSYGYTHLGSGDEKRSIELLEQGAAIFANRGDIENAAYYIADLERTKEIRQQPVTPQRAYIYGTGHIREKDGRLYHARSSRIRFEGEKFPPGDGKGTPMTDLFRNGPFTGIELLLDDVGSSCTDNSNIGTPRGTESMRTASTLKSKSETVTVPAGEFSGCALIETHISTSDEARVENIERDFYLGYWGGTKQAWFAPGVGLVRLIRQHNNGYITDIQLVEYEITEQTDNYFKQAGSMFYFPLARDSRWRYRWVDQEVGTVFEDSLRVAACKNAKWIMAFVTRATAK